MNYKLYKVIKQSLQKDTFLQPGERPTNFPDLCFELWSIYLRSDCTHSCTTGYLNVQSVDRDFRWIYLQSNIDSRENAVDRIFDAGNTVMSISQSINVMGFSDCFNCQRGLCFLCSGFPFQSIVVRSCDFITYPL